MLLRERIQVAALLEFRQRGYAGASIDGIARAATVSRTTIYALYIDKETLFTEMIRAAITTTDIAGRVAFDDRPPRAVLADALAALNRAYYRQPNLEILRLCIAEADHFPDLFAEIFKLLAATLTGLTAYFERLHRTGAMTTADPHRAALLFNMLALGSLKPFFVHQTRLTRPETDGHLDMALDIFLNGCLSEAD